MGVWVAGGLADDGWLGGRIAVAVAGAGAELLASEL